MGDTEKLWLQPPRLRQDAAAALQPDCCRRPRPGSAEHGNPLAPRKQGRTLRPGSTEDRALRKVVHHDASLTMADSILVQPPPRSWYHAQLAQAFWPRLPLILEHEHYGSSKAKQAWGDGRLLLEAVEQYHASYMSIHWWPRELLAENRDVISQINRRLGYRLLPRQISWPAEVRLGDAFTVHSQWSNVGVAPCYPGGFFALTLKDDQGGIVAVHVDESLDMRDLPVGPADDLQQTTLSSEFQLARC